MKKSTSTLPLLLIALSVACFGTALSQNWPSFRGPEAGGVVEGQKLPAFWNAETGEGIKWKRRIPGLAHSSPIVWQDSVFVTTAVSSVGDDSFRPGLYGDGTASGDTSIHEWKIYALDKKTGDLRWEQTAYRGQPVEKRHIKATYANSTPVTDGRVVVAFFGSQGLYAYDMRGHFLWKRDFGHLDVGAYDAPEYEWGTATSPIIYRDSVILQLDTQQRDVLVALDLKSGATVWEVERDELPSWGTPTIYRGADRVELITNASNLIRGNDPDTGRDLWRLGGSSQITAPTPIFDNDLIVVASGRGPVKPIFVIRAGADGDITLPEGTNTNESILWSMRGRGPYMPTPIIVEGRLYVLQNQGILDCYDLKSGRELYRNRIPHQGSGFSGSPVAADGVIYLPSEDGDIFAIQAGPEFKLISQNPVGEHLMATPAISDGMMYIRGHHTLFAVGR